MTAHKTSRFICYAIAVMLAAVSIPASAATVDFNPPTSLSFFVSNVKSATTGAPNPTALGFANAQLSGNQAIRISVMAVSPTLTTPLGGGTPMPVSKVTWTTANAVNGTASGGTLSYNTYTVVFTGSRKSRNGSVNLKWNLAVPDVGIRGGNHSLSLRWKIEVI